MQAIIAIDPSLSNTAMCLLLQDGTHEMRCVSRPPAKIGWNHRHQRYVHYATALRTLVDSRKSEGLLNLPRFIFFEGYSFGSQGQGTIDRAEMGTVLRQTAAVNVPFDYCVIEVAPKSVKQFAASNGNASKTLMVASLTKRYGVEFKTDDEYDAFALAQLGACALGWTEPVNDAQRKAVAVVQQLIAANQEGAT
jgi:Holliday junction resolvasome RuvABC endonuclease subunit